MKKIIFNLMLLILFFLVLFFLFYQSNSTTVNSKRDYILVKLSNKKAYPFYKPFAIGTSAKLAIEKLQEVAKEPKKIYLKVKRKWEKVDINKKLFADSLLKAEY